MFRAVPVSGDRRCRGDAYGWKDESGFSAGRTRDRRRVPGLEPISRRPRATLPTDRAGVRNLLRRRRSCVPRILKLSQECAMRDQYLCPVCGYDRLDEPPWDNESPSDEICPSCGTHFGYDDAAGGSAAQRQARHRDLRERWKAAGCPWFSRTAWQPEDWNPRTQLVSVEE